VVLFLPGAPSPSGSSRSAAVASWVELGPGGLALVLSAVNAKNLVVCVAAAAAVAVAGLSGTRATWSVVVFRMMAPSTVAMPVLAYAVGRRRMAGPLESLRGRLNAHSAAVTAVLLLVIGVVLIGQGLRGLV
jgi:hypothetical protein